MSNIVYWDELSRDDQYAVLTEAIRRESSEDLDDDAFGIASWIIEQFWHNSSLFPRCGELWVDPDEVVGVSRICDSEDAGAFDLAFSLSDLDQDHPDQDHYRFWSFDAGSEFVDAFEPVLAAFAAYVPFEDLEWPDELDFGEFDLDDFDLEDLSHLAADFVSRVSEGKPCNLGTWREAVCSQVDSLVTDLVFCGDDGLCRFDVTWWVNAFLRDLADHPYHCSFLGCDIAARS